jgi:CubicO group peptidase (beta-lactamase class C family)
MTKSGFVREAAPAGAVDAVANFLHAPSFNLGAWSKGAGDLIATAADMARWNVALTSGRVLGYPSVRLMTTPVAPVTDSELYRGRSYAMGWYVCERPRYRLIEHGGIISGFMASNVIGRQPDGSWMSVSVMGNIDATADVVLLARSIIQAGD